MHLPGTVDLMLAFLEYGTQFATGFAVDDEGMYASLGSTLGEAGLRRSASTSVASNMCQPRRSTRDCRVHCSCSQCNRGKTGLSPRVGMIALTNYA